MVLTLIVVCGGLNLCVLLSTAPCGIVTLNVTVEKEGLFNICYKGFISFSPSLLAEVMVTCGASTCSTPHKLWALAVRQLI